MRRGISGLRNKLMAGTALVMACALATPAAFARDHNGHDDSDVLGALVVGAVIGGLLVSATDHDRDYGYYPARSYAPVGYYGAAYRSAPYYGPGYHGGGYYPRYGYGHGVSVNIHSGRGHSHGGGYYRSHDDHHGYDHRYRDAGHGSGGYYRTGNPHDHHRDSGGSYYKH